MSFFCFSHNLIGKVFSNELNLNFPFFKTQQRHNHTHGIYTHTTEDRMVTNLLILSPKHLPNTNNPWCQTHIRINGQKTQIALHAHRCSSMAGKHQNQLTKCPIKHLFKEKFAQVHSSELTQFLNSSTHSDACFYSTKDKCKLAASAVLRKSREDHQSK